MRATTTAWLIVGFGIGFGVMYSYISPKAADLARPLPQFVPQSASGPQAIAGDPEVIRQLQAALSANPDDFQALRALGNIRYDERNFDDAADLYARALSVRPDDVNVRSDRGGALLQARRLDEAIQELQVALSKEPTHPQALFILGFALLEGKGDNAGALEKWRKLVETNPDLPMLDEVKQQIRRVEDMSRRQ